MGKRSTSTVYQRSAGTEPVQHPALPLPGTRSEEVLCKKALCRASVGWSRRGRVRRVSTPSRTAAQSVTTPTAPAAASAAKKHAAISARRAHRRPGQGPDAADDPCGARHTVAQAALQSSSSTVSRALPSVYTAAALPAPGGSASARLRATGTEPCAHSCWSSARVARAPRAAAEQRPTGALERRAINS